MRHAQASVFEEAPRFGGEGVSLNGIVYHPGGHFLVAMGSAKKLCKVHHNASRKYGMKLRDDGQLVAAAPSAPGVVELTSRDGWRSAQVVERASTALDNTTEVVPRAGALAPESGPVLSSHRNIVVNP